MREELGSIPITFAEGSSEDICAVRLPGPHPISRICVLGVLVRASFWRRYKPALNWVTLTRV